METKDKAFIDYLNGCTKKEIMKKRDVAEGTLNSWMSRENWAVRKKGCVNEDGTLDVGAIKEYMAGKGKGNYLNAIDNDILHKTREEVFYETPHDREMAMFISRTLHNSMRDLCNSKAKDDDEVVVRIESYFHFCESECVIPTVEGLALSLGISKTTFFGWRDGKRGTVRGDFLKKAQLVINEFDTQMAITGKMPTLLYFFRSKNYYGMKDQIDTVVTHNNPMGDGRTAQEIEDSLDDLPDTGDKPIIDVEFDEL